MMTLLSWCLIAGIENEDFTPKDILISAWKRP